MANRQKQIIKASIIGVIANVFLVIFKMLVGVIAGSIAVILDAVNNLTDVLSSIVTIVGTKLASRKPDPGHPYGHGRLEYIAALMVGVIILVTGIMSMMESIPKIIHPELADYSWATIAVVVSAVVIKLALGTYVRKVGKKYDSASLQASGIDALFDALLSVATLVGIAVTMLWQISIDGILGGLISLLILRTSIEIGMEAIRDLMGRVADPELVRKLKAWIRSFPEVKDAYDFNLHDYGPSEFVGSVHIQVSEDLDAKQIHRLTHEIAQKAFSKYGVILTIGIYADNANTGLNREMRLNIREIISQYPEVHQMHGLYIDQEAKLISFDVEVDYRKGDQRKLKTKLNRQIRKLYPDYQCMITLDLDTSGE